ncbi:MAG TPA: ComEC/Rec2 family competence protein, partial [Polyangiaceae bacterium]|nr:ComEC/Rec2 family competence protein [Polyangiaceae bacterium]
QGRVVSSPRVKTQLEQEKGAQVTALFNVQFTQLECNEVLLPGPIVARIASPSFDVVRGDWVHVLAQLSPPQLFRNPHLTDPWPAAARNGATLSGSALELEVLGEAAPADLLLQAGGIIDRFRAQVRSRITHTYAPAVVTLGRALVLGESDLAPDEADAFRDSGLMHLLAVSGTHLVIFVVSVVRLLRAVLVRLTFWSARFDVSRWSSAFGAVTSLLYADFAGGSGSALRAAYMLCLVAGARSLGFRLSGKSALGLSLVLGLALEPLAAHDFSFLLSALATTGLIGLGQPLSRLCARGVLGRGPLGALTESLCATVASTAPCAPVMALMSDHMTWAALLANVVAAPLGEVIALPACLLHAVVPFAPRLESGLALLGSGALYGVRATALLSASSQFAQFTVPFPHTSRLGLGLAALLLGLLGWGRAARHGAEQSGAGQLGAARLMFAGTLLVVFFWGAHATWGKRAQNGRLSVTALDVGQGDALFIEFPGGQVGLVDGGGFPTGTPDTGQRVLLPFLRARGVTRLDLMVLSHAHPDHILGLLSVAAQVPVTELWYPDAGGAPERAPQSLLDLIARVRARGGRAQPASNLCAHPQAFGGTEIDVFSPCVVNTPPFELNDGSLVLRLRYKQRSALLTGDIEERAETQLLAARGDDLRADLLKVAHHGSATSSAPAFVQAVAPRVAFISSGVRNRFGHPRPETLDTLAQKHVATFRTDQQGALSWVSDGQSWTVHSFDPAPIHHPKGAQGPRSFAHASVMVSP